MVTKEHLLSLNPNNIPTMAMFLELVASAKSHYPDGRFRDKCVAEPEGGLLEFCRLGTPLVKLVTTEVRDLYTALIEDLRITSLYEEFRTNRETTLVIGTNGTFLFNSDKDVTDHAKLYLPKLRANRIGRMQIYVLGRDYSNAEISTHYDSSNLVYDHYRTGGDGVSRGMEQELPDARIDELPAVLNAIRNNVLYRKK